MLNRPSRRQYIRRTAAFGHTAGLLPGFAAASAEQLQACAAEPAGPKWSRGPPIYQIFTRFYSKDGSLASIKADLPRIKAMNVGIIYMMPIHPCTDNPDLNAQRKCNYFQSADYMAVNPVLGTSDDWMDFVQAVHDSGMYRSCPFSDRRIWQLRRNCGRIRVGCLGSGCLSRASSSSFYAAQVN